MKSSLPKPPRIYLSLFFIVLLVVIVAGTNYYLKIREEKKKEVYNNLSILADVKTSQVISWCNERISDAKFLKNNYAFKELVLTFLRNPKDSKSKEALIDWFSQLKENHEYTDVQIISRSNKIYSLFSDNDTLLEKDPENIKMVYKEKRIRLGSLNKDTQTGVISLGTFIPLSLSNQDIFALIKLVMDPQINLYPLISKVSGESITSETFIVRKDGDSVTFLNNLRNKKNSAVSYKLPLSLSSLPAAMAVKGKRGIYEGVDYNGIKVLAHLGKIQSTPWFIISKIDLDEVYEPILKQGLIIATGMMTIIIIFGLLIFSAWKNEKVIYLNRQLAIEKKLIESSMHFSNIVQTAMDGVITVDESMRIIVFNKSAEKIFGVKADKAIGQPIEKFIPERFHDKHKKNIELFSYSDSEPRLMGVNNVITGIDASGKEINMEASISHFEIEGHKYYTVIHRDITQKKETEEALKRSEEKFAKIFMNSPVGMGLIDAETFKVIDVNSVFQRLYGFTREEAIGKTTIELNLYENIEDRAKIISKLKKGEMIRDMELNTKQRDGKVRIVLLNVEIIIIEGKPCLLVVAQDISERKIIELALRKSEEKFARIFNNSPVAMALADTIEFRTIDVNPAFEQLYGYKKEEMIGKTSQDLLLYDDMKERENIIAKLKRGELLKELELTIRRKDGERRIVLVSNEQIEIEERKCLLTVSQDITDRKRVEYEILSNAREMEAVLNCIADGVFVYDKEGRILRSNSKADFILGYNNNEHDLTLEEREDNLFSVYTEDGRKMSADELPAFRAAKFGETFNNVFLMLETRSGKKWINVSAAPLIVSGIHTGAVVSISDITYRKLAEEELKISEQRYRDLIESQQEYIARVDREGRYIFANEAYYRKFLVSQEDLIGKANFQPIVYPDDLSETMEKLKELERYPHRVKYEQRAYTSEGIRWIEWESTAILDEQGNIIEVQGVGRDINDRKLAEEALRESEQQLKRAQEIAHLGSWELDLEKNELTWSDEVYRIFGLEPGEFASTYEAFVQAVHPDDRTLVDNAYSGSISEGSDTYEVEHRIVRRTGEIRIVHEKCKHLRNKKGRIIRSVGMVHDITERKMAEESYSLLFNSIDEGFCIIEVLFEDGKPYDYIFREINPAFEKQTGLTNAKNKRVGELVPGHEQYWFNIYGNVALSGESTRFQNKAEKLDRWYNVYAFRIGPAEERKVAVLFSDITEQKLSEEKLLASEERFSKAFNANPNALVLSRIADGIILEVNETFLEIFKYSRDEVIGKSSLDLQMFANPDDRIKAISELKQSGYLHDFELKIKTKTGEERIAILSAEILKTRSGNSFLTIIQDITERRMVEMAVVESEQRFRQLADSMPQLVWTANPDGIVDYYNKRVLEFEGFLQDENKKWNWAPVVHKDDLEVTKNAWESAVKTGNTYEVTHRVKNKSGEFKWYLSRGVPIKNEKGKVIKWYGTATDINKQKLIEDELSNALDRLSESENKLLEAQRIAHIGSYTLDLKSGNVEWSDEMYNIFDLDKSDGIISAEKIFKFVHPGDVDKINQSYQEVISNNKEIEYEFRIITDKGLKYLFTHGETILDETGNVKNIFGTVMDITARKLAQLKLEETLNELTRSNKDLEQFAYTASHDLQEPVRMIKLYSSMIKSRFMENIPETGHQYFNFVIEGAARMQELINDLLRYSRVSTIKQEFEAVDCNFIVGVVLNDLKVLIQDQNALININTLPVVKADKTQMRQLFQNFIQNAIKFRSEKKPVISISSERTDGKWLFSIKDNGIGIPEIHQQRIFTIFQRLHEREQYPGTGVGLAICKKIVERHGGEIYVDSEPGNGSTFYFTLPA